MQDKLIGLLLDAPDQEERLRVERAIAKDQQLQRELELLRQALVPLQGDRDCVDAPDGLAVRTCHWIRQRGIDEP